MVYLREGRGSRGTTTVAAGGTSDGKSNKLKEAYTNVDGIISSMLEIRDYQNFQKPDVFCMVETKLKEEIQISFQQEENRIFRRNRKGNGGGILIMVQEDIFVEEVQAYGDGMAEVIGITIITNERERRKIIVTYVPPKTNTWKLEEHK